ncbi:XRE family transcriptional regulator [Lactococcus lactis subsp. lactis]|uniref:XRE family transcriptional regulator n=1 Tax=Lactococcus lactis subsp. lactis TaxID=1360 RepID=A0A2Z3KRD0_LACLL|nr:S24 family peptidase [Lactococcus lactis]AWN66479.1 XRE family transcriptional regulator [Lactococcus lactis subsp. lactis]
MNFGQKLKKLREDRNLKQSDIAEILGIKQSSYVTWEQKETNPTLELLTKIAEYYNISLDNLLFDKINQVGISRQISKLDAEQQVLVAEFIEFLNEKNHKKRYAKETQIIELKTYLRDTLNEVKVFDESLSAGFGVGLIDNQETYRVYTDKKIRNHDGAARIAGDSMQPNIPNGSIVTFKANGFDQDGEIYVISEGGYNEETLYCKQVFLDEDGYRCHSLNTSPQYRDFYLGEDARIIGTVVDCFEEISPDLIVD